MREFDYMPYNPDYFYPEDPPDDDDRVDEDSDEFLVAICYQEHGLRLNIDTVRGWSAEDWEQADDWANGRLKTKPAVIEAAESEYAAARKCRVCGCTDYFACEGGCSWVELDLCSECVRRADQ